MTTTHYPAKLKTTTIQEAAKSRLENVWGEPLFLADWAEPVFLHFTVDPDLLQPFVPFPLDVRDGKAWITLVAFTMRDMRFRIGGNYTKWLTTPIATHSFLNLRTYVKYNGEPGIHFICEWLNCRAAVNLGPITFGLPYRYADIEYHHDYDNADFAGRVAWGNKAIEYHAEAEPGNDWPTCEAGTADEFLLERYTAFTAVGKLRGCFRVWHKPWPQKRLTNVQFKDLSLHDETPGAEHWVKHLRFEFANVSTGATDVWMGRPHVFF